MLIRFATLNIWLSKNPDAALAFKKERAQMGHPLVLGLQEVDRGAPRSGKMDVLKHIAGSDAFFYSESLSMDPRHEIPHPCPSEVETPWDMGVGLVTNLKIKQSFKIDLGPEADVFWESPPKEERSMATMIWEREPRSAAFAQIQSPDGDFWAITTHLAHKTDRNLPSVFRQSQIEVLLREVQKNIGPKEPVVLMGDMNATTENPDLEPLKSHFTHCPPQDATFTGRNGEGLIVDHIFFRNAEIITPSRALEAPFSDHKAVEILLKLTP